MYKTIKFNILKNYLLVTKICYNIMYHKYKYIFYVFNLSQRKGGIYNLYFNPFWKGEVIMFKKVLIKKLMPAILSFGIFSLFSAGAFSDTAHKYVTRTSFEAFSEMNCDDNMRKSFQNLAEASEFFKNDEKEYKELFIKYSIQPDIDETQGIFKYHFYNPITETNFMNEKDSALTRFKEHFEKAVSNYKMDNKNMAYQELGRAVHFMEDMNTPVHTAYELPSDSVKKLPMHVDFEKVCDQLCGECKLNLVAQSLKYYEINNFDTISRSAATLSADNFYYLENNKMDKEELARYAVLNAQKNVSGILYRFFIEVLKS